MSFFVCYLFQVLLMWNHDNTDISLFSGLSVVLATCVALLQAAPKWPFCVSICLHVAAFDGKHNLSYARARVTVCRFTPDLAALWYIYKIPYCFNSHYRIYGFPDFLWWSFLTDPQLETQWKLRMPQKPERKRQTVLLIQWCQNSDLNCRKT